MLETFNVLRIDEPDFGCEGRPDGMEVKDNVLLKSNYTGQEMTVQEKDARLYELDINEGDKVFLMEGERRKLRGEQRIADAAFKKGADKYMQRTLKDGI